METNKKKRNEIAMLINLQIYFVLDVGLFPVKTKMFIITIMTVHWMFFNLNNSPSEQSL